MPLFLGLDCGGSTCRALLGDERGTVHFKGQAGAANIAATPPRLLQANLQKALYGCPKPDVVCGCFAGLLTQEDGERAGRLLGDLFPSAQVVTFPDYAAAHAASDADLTVVAGTGSVVCSRIDGKFVKTGGRGYVLGDEGSGFRYGRASLLHYLEVGPASASPALREAVARHLGSTEEPAAVAALYRAGSPQAKLSRITDAFVADWERGESYAKMYLAEESDRLAETVAKHVRTFHAGKAGLNGSLAGGLWRASRRFQEALEASIANGVCESQVIFTPLKRAPVLGALNLAMEVMNEY